MRVLAAPRVASESRQRPSKGFMALLIVWVFMILGWVVLLSFDEAIPCIPIEPPIPKCPLMKEKPPVCREVSLVRVTIAKKLLNTDREMTGQRPFPVEVRDKGAIGECAFWESVGKISERHTA